MVISGLLKFELQALDVDSVLLITIDGAKSASFSFSSRCLRFFLQPRKDFLQRGDCAPVIFLGFQKLLALHATLFSLALQSARLYCILFCERGILLDHSWDVVSEHQRDNSRVLLEQGLDLLMSGYVALAVGGIEQIAHLASVTSLNNLEVAAKY